LIHFYKRYIEPVSVKQTYLLVITLPFMMLKSP